MRKIAIMILILFALLVIWFCPTNATKSQPAPMPAQAASPMNATEFWSQSIPALETLPQNLTLYNASTEVLDGKLITIWNISFVSLNFYNQPGNLTMWGYLVLPDNRSGSLGAVPGILLLHGMFADTNETLLAAEHYAANNFIALCYDQPGHGRSDGPKPNATNFFSPSFATNYNETSHLYLSNCAALRGLVVLNAQFGINQSQIVVGGASYGGINAMMAAGVAGMLSIKVAAVIDGIAAGDFPTSAQSPGKLTGYLVGGDTPQFEAVYAQIKGYYDPISYVSLPGYPPMLTICGTNDEFFDLTAFNETFAADLSPKSAIQVNPNGHHAVDLNSTTIDYWLNAVLFNESIVPDIVYASTLNHGIGDFVTLECAVNNAAPVASVEVAYAYVDLLGYAWHTEVTQTSNGFDYVAGVPAPYMSSNTEYFIIVTLTNGEVFTTPVMSVYLNGSLTVYCWICLVLAVVFLVALVAWRQLRGVAKAKQLLGDEMDPLVRRKTILTLVIVAANGVNIVLAFYLPIVNLNGVTSWDASYIINNYLPQVLPATNELTGLLLVVAMVVGFGISLWVPFLAGMADLILPIAVAAIWGSLLATIGAFAAFGPIYPGVGVYVMILGSGIAIAAGIFRMRYWHPVQRAVKAKLSAQRETIQEVEKE
jgi:pimeloyl-ACP methyl ester carboxylesterase